MDDQMKREIILDNYQNPYHRGFKEEENYIKVNSRSDSCIDNITIAALVENGVITDVRFEGEACAICTSATSVILKTLIGKKVEDAEKIMDNYNKMINEEKYDDSVLEELNIYDTVYRQPSRKNCALLPYKAMMSILKK